MNNFKPVSKSFNKTTETTKNLKNNKKVKRGRSTKTLVEFLSLFEIGEVVRLNPKYIKAYDIKDKIDKIILTKPLTVLEHKLNEKANVPVIYFKETGEFIPFSGHHFIKIKEDD